MTELYSPEFFADPISYYSELRERDPIHWNAEHQVWVLTRHADVTMLTRQPDRFSSALSVHEQGEPVPPIRDIDRSAAEFVKGLRTLEFIQLDPPAHGLKRAPTATAFASKELERIRPMVRAIIDELLDRVDGDGGTDLLTAVGRPLPMIVIARLLGLEPGDAATIAEQARRRMASVLTLTEDRMGIAAAGFRDTAAYLDAPLDERARCPRHDVLSDIAVAERNGIYTREESHANAMLLIDAGHETTIQLVCNGTLMLMRHPDQWERLVGDPSGLAQSATEECLRYDPPLHAFRRVAAVDVELEGKVIRAGERILGVVASANRDPRRFADPDRFDIGRKPNPHLSFGGGAHYCLGQYLARVEGQEYFAAIAQRFPTLRLADPAAAVDYFSTPRVRSMTALPVRWD